MENFIFGLIFQFMPTKRPQNIKRTKQAKQINVPVFHITSYFPFVFWGAFRYILLSLRGNKNPLNYLIKMAPYIYRFNNWFGNENNVCEGNFKFFFLDCGEYFYCMPQGATNKPHSPYYPRIKKYIATRRLACKLQHRILSTNFQKLGITKMGAKIYA